MTFYTVLHLSIKNYKRIKYRLRLFISALYMLYDVYCIYQPKLLTRKKFLHIHALYTIYTGGHLIQVYVVNDFFFFLYTSPGIELLVYKFSLIVRMNIKYFRGAQNRGERRSSIKVHLTLINPVITQAFCQDVLWKFGISDNKCSV